MCTIDRGMDIYANENPAELARLHCGIFEEALDAECMIIAFGHKIAAHLTVRELLFPVGAEAWDPILMVDLAAYLIGDENMVDEIPESTRHTWHMRMLSRLQKDKELRKDVAALVAREDKVRPAIFANEWKILSTAKLLSASLENVDACLTIIGPQSLQRQ